MPKAHAQGYQPDDDDGDVLALHQRFGTPLLPPYDTWPGARGGPERPS